VLNHADRQLSTRCFPPAERLRFMAQPSDHSPQPAIHTVGVADFVGALVSGFRPISRRPGAPHHRRGPANWPSPAWLLHHRSRPAVGISVLHHGIERPMQILQWTGGLDNARVHTAAAPCGRTDHIRNARVSVAQTRPLEMYRIDWARGAFREPDWADRAARSWRQRVSSASSARSSRPSAERVPITHDPV